MWRGSKPAKSIEEMWADEEALSLEERRDRYNCGTRFITLDRIPTWTDYIVQLKQRREREKKEREERRQERLKRKQEAEVRRKEKEERRQQRDLERKAKEAEAQAKKSEAQTTTVNTNEDVKTNNTTTTTSSESKQESDAMAVDESSQPQTSDSNQSESNNNKESSQDDGAMQVSQDPQSNKDEVEDDENEDEEEDEEEDEDDEEEEDEEEEEEEEKETDEMQQDSSSPYFYSSKYNSILSLIRSDITTLEIDAIVNAANTSLLGGGGIDGAIHRAAGGKLYEECLQLNGCASGSAKISRGYKLPAKYVLHTVGPIGENKRVLTSAYESVLKLAVENNIRTVALCGISTGIYGYPLVNASKVALETIRSFLDGRRERGGKQD
eukprot:TRINITY_DN1011_c0_g1_i1.p1 TRINITY_DN1011_c0_g1~~TRINITY_DN1011_c0_g1_i1.p1  ORF type:complete len:408 (+),score=189.76 TRINITY_DN1011_c0_g1_i1:81-1226(+)